MKEKEQKGIEMELTMTFDNKESLKEFIDNFGKAIAKEQAEALKDLYKGQFENEKKPEVFQPQKGDICTCEIEGNIDTIFRYDGNTTTDDDGVVWLDGDLSLTWSGDLFKPYMIIHGEDSGYDRDCCRPATEEEIALFRDKVKEFDTANEKEGKKWNVGDLVYVVGSETGCSEVFYTALLTYEDSKFMENRVRRGWVFDKKSDCQAVCDKLNEAIKNVKP